MDKRAKDNYIILYKTLIRPVVSCGAETWTLTEREEQAVLIFERKIFRRMCGSKYENGEWKLYYVSGAETWTLTRRKKNKLC